VNQQTTHSKKAALGYLVRVRNKFLTEATKALFKRPLAVRNTFPLISFTFDDFPRSAFLEAGSILMRYGVRGTYYTSLGLMAKQSHMGLMYEADDLAELVRLGHELGCHTFGHCHSWDTPADEYEKAILDNQLAFNEVLPGASFKTFAYPHSPPRIEVKKVAGRHFLCCRGGGLKPGRYLHRHSAGGQTFNAGITDLNYLCAFFLEKSRGNPEAVKNLIDQNARARGWLIFATHDVRTNPSLYGCTPDFFEQAVQWSLESGARILPVVEALEVLRASQPEVTTRPSHAGHTCDVSGMK
jgi:peptidoglycan/xylan/chitin deacetylase (PgdA/CDA1 family)